MCNEGQIGQSNLNGFFAVLDSLQFFRSSSNYNIPVATVPVPVHDNCLWVWHYLKGLPHSSNNFLYAFVYDCTYKNCYESIDILSINHSANNSMLHNLAFPHDFHPFCRESPLIFKQTK